VSFYAEIIKGGRTSITVECRYISQPHPAEPSCVKVTEATLTYVAVSEDRKPPRSTAGELKSLSFPVTLAQAGERRESRLLDDPSVAGNMKVWFAKRSFCLAGFPAFAE